MRATPQTHPEEFIAALDAQGFKPNNKWDRAGSNDRTLDLLSSEGCPLLRVITDSYGEQEIHNISILAFNGLRNELIDWQAGHLSAYMPSVAILAMITAMIGASV